MVTFGGGPAAETPIEARPDFDDVPDDLLDIVRRVVAEDATDILPAKRAIAELVEWYRERGGK